MWLSARAKDGTIKSEQRKWSGQAASSYMKKAGLPYSPPNEFVKLDPEYSKRIAAAYASMPHAPNDPSVKAAYRAMIDETLAQWREIDTTGLKVTFATEGKPYPYNV